MTEGQRKAAAVVAMILVVIPAVVLAWLAGDTLGDGPLGDNQPGRFVLAVAKAGEGAMLALQGIPLVIAVGLSLLIPKTGIDWRFIATVAALLIGLLVSIYLYFAFQDAETAHRMWSYSTVPGVQSPSELEAALSPKLLALGAWFLATLAAQVGIKLKDEPGQDKPPSNAPAKEGPAKEKTGEDKPADGEPEHEEPDHTDPDDDLPGETQ